MAAVVVGREAELAAVADFLGRSGGEPRAVVVVGEPGIGKTTIVRAALAGAASVGVRLLVARPAAGELELPYAGLGDLLETVSIDALAVLPAPQREAVEVALGRRASGNRVDGHALSRGLLQLLRFLSAQGELLVAIDDVQWLDRPTVSALSFALRRLGLVSMRVLVAARTVPGRSWELPLGLGEWQNVHRICVGPLSTTELGTVVNQRLVEPLPRPSLKALARASRGNPMFALELATQMRGPGVPAPTLSVAVEARMRDLDARVRVLLALVAAALQPSADLLREAGLERTELRLALDTGLIEADGERLSFAHPVLASAAYETLLPDERLVIHERLAAATTRAIERGHHVWLSTAGHDESAAATLDDAAGEAARLGDHGGAARFLLRAAERSLGPERDRREVSAASELETAGDVDGAARLAAKLLARLPAGVVRARARQTLVSCRLGSHLSYDEARVELGLALEDAGAEVATAAEILVAMAAVASATCRLEASLEYLHTAEKLAERTEAPEILVAVRSEIGFTECMLGRGVSPSALRALEDWDGTILSPDGYSPRMALACARLHATEFDRAERLLLDELRFAEERGLEAVEVVARGHLAECQLRAGRWSEALVNGRLAVEHARQSANRQVLTGVCYSLAAVQAVVGNHDVARSLADEALADAEATGDFWFIVSHRSVLGLIALAEDDPQAVLEALEPAWALMLERDLGDLSIFPVAQVLGEALAAVGRSREVAAIGETLRASPAGKRPWCRTMASRCDALVASARGDHAAARSAIASALAAQADLPEPFEHARLMRLKGRVERRARRWGAARSALVAAHQRFAALGAARWAENTTADLAHLPGRRPAGTDALTPREREIAELVARGLANKQVAARLFVTVRTVEANLSKVYAKLGVRSRTELASRLAPHIGE